MGKILKRYKEWKEYKRKNKVYFMMKSFAICSKRCYTFWEFMTHSDEELQEIELYASPIMKAHLEPLIEKRDNK